MDRFENIKKRIEAKLEELYPVTNINGRNCYQLKGGYCIRIDCIKKFNSVVVEFAENIDCAQQNMFDDGELYDVDEYTLDEIIDKVIAEIEYTENS